MQLMCKVTLLRCLLLALQSVPSFVLPACGRVRALGWGQVSGTCPALASCAKGGWLLHSKEPSTPALADICRGPLSSPHGVTGPTHAGSGLQPGLAWGSLGASLACVPPVSLPLSKLLPQHLVRELAEPAAFFPLVLAGLGPLSVPTERDPIWALVLPGAGVLPTSHLWPVSEPSSPLP